MVSVCFCHRKRCAKVLEIFVEPQKLCAFVGSKREVTGKRVPGVGCQSQSLNVKSESKKRK